MNTNLKLHALVAVVLVLAGCGASNPSDDLRDVSPGASGGSVEVDATSMPPWPAPVGDVPDRVAAAGLDLGPMGTAEHYHPRLEVVVDGQEVRIPANIGVDPATGAMSALHTHETDGTIHVEADAPGEVVTLGQLFTQWGIALTDTRIGGVTTRPGETVEVTSNGEPVDGDPGELRLEPEQTIVLQVR